MNFILNTTSDIRGDERLSEIAESIIGAGVTHHADKLSRIEVHLSDENGSKGGSDDIRCMVEVRPLGLKPLAVTHNDAAVEAALRGAASKIRSLLDSEFGKRSRR